MSVIIHRDMERCIILNFVLFFPSLFIWLQVLQSMAGDPALTMMYLY